MFESKLGGEEVIFKFPYGTTVHRHLAKLKLAPQLMHVQALPRPWDVIIMEKAQTPPSRRVKSALRYVATKHTYIKNPVNLKKEAYRDGEGDKIGMRYMKHG